MNAQTSFLNDLPAAQDLAVSFRPIHYLGSKLRMLGAIRRVIDDVDPASGPICDLFSGSATVGAAFARSRPVVAVDIQEYAKVLASAILRPAELDENTISAAIRNAQESDHAAALLRSIEPMIEYEAECLRASVLGEPAALCDLLEAGSLVSNCESGSNASGSGRLGAAYRETVTRLRAAELESSPDSLVSRYFGGLYFSFLQAVHLDLLLREISQQSIHLRHSLTAALLSTTSDIVNTVGKQFAQPLRPRSSDGRPKRHLISKIARDRSVAVFAAYRVWLERYASLAACEQSHEVFCDDYRHFLDTYEGRPSVIYADPPYTRDHYSRYYHVLETICLRDNPTVSVSVQKGQRALSRGLYRQERHQSPFCIASQAPGAFEALFKKARRFSVPLVVSYSPFDKSQRERPRLLTIDAVTRLAKSAFSDIDVISVDDISHNKLGWSESTVSKNDAERLIVCRP